MAFLPLRAFPFVLITPADHPLGRQPSVELRQLENQPFLFYSEESGCAGGSGKFWRNTGFPFGLL